ncbi:MAG TPA: CoA transferase [Solirubrobacteraceae bacterium]|nr:CoA transferase [Solirubrobacteraceae bacterium]
MAKPLRDVRILELATVLAAPLTSTLLAEYGAEVVKVEQPGTGDPVRGYAPYSGEESLHWRVTGRNKKSVTLDLHEPEAREIALALAGRSDVVVTNFRPGTLRAWGLDYPQLSEIKPDLIMYHLTGFGRTGPYADRPGFARIAEALSGLASLTGYPDRPPVFAGYPIADGIAGVYGAFAVMLALRHRDATGEGQLVDLALYEPLLRMMEDLVVGFATTGRMKERSGTAQPNICPNNVFPTLDGEYLILPASTEQMWQRLVKLLDLAEFRGWDSNQQRLDHREEIEQGIARYTSRYPLVDLLERFDDAGIACGRFYSAADIVADPHVRERGNLMEIWDEGLQRQLTVQAPIPHFSSLTAEVTPAPGLGQHTDEVLCRDLGLDPALVHDYRQRGIV